MADTAFTVKVHLDIDLDGEPITRVLDMPASMERLSAKGEPGGLHIHLSIDGRKLAKALIPHIGAAVRGGSDLRLD